MQEREEEGKLKFSEESNAPRSTSGVDVVLRLGWDYITTPQNHTQFPADFRQKATIALAWQLPLVSFNRKPGDLVRSRWQRDPRLLRPTIAAL